MRLITLNLRHNVDRWEERFPLVVDVLHAEQADVIAFQEVYLSIKQAHIIADALNQRIPDQPYGVYVESKWGHNPVEGVGLLSRLPILERERLNLPEIERVAQRVRLDVNGTVVNLANTHLHHRPADDEVIRLPQMQALLEWMFKHDDRGWLLTGDMNAVPGSSTITAANKYLRSAYPAVHGKEPITCPTPLNVEEYPHIQLTIDYIFFDPAAFRISDARVIANQPHPDDNTLYPSDHYGLAADLELLGS